jgi:hypothetical protein
MRRLIVTKEQLNEFVETKKAEKVFYDIVEELHKNGKFLNESVSKNKANRTVIENYRRKNLITPKVLEMLIKNKIIDESYEIL